MDNFVHQQPDSAVDSMLRRESSGLRTWGLGLGDGSRRHPGILRPRMLRGAEGSSPLLNPSEGFKVPLDRRMSH